MTAVHPPLDERTFATTLIERVIAECPRRQAGSDSERRTQAIVQEHLSELGLACRVHEFRFNDNLYATMALHFGVAVTGTAVAGVSPVLGAALRALAAGSYFADSARSGYLLRRLFPFRRSQNLVATLPAEGAPRLRLVVLAHTDAAFTGVVFDPRFIRAMGPASLPEPLKFLGRSLAVATCTEAAGAGVTALRAALGPVGWFLRPVELALAIPALLAFALNLQVVLRNEVVPGATDDLSGVAGMCLLAARLIATKRPDVELVFVATGAEEAGTGGAYSLARDMRAEWDPATTVILGLDGLSNGELSWFEEGEIVREPVPQWLRETLGEAAASDPRFASVRAFEAPVGATDVYPFRRQGYDGVCLGYVDRELGAPRNYHVPTDTLENLDPDDIVRCVDFAEKVVAGIVKARLTPP